MTSTHAGYTLYLVTNIAVYNDHQQANDEFSVTSQLSEQLVSIPVHHGLTDVELERIVEAINSY